eukprot:scaffold43941_cov33-Tisochrysis_lutea.AAC.10
MGPSYADEGFAISARPTPTRTARIARARLLAAPGHASCGSAATTGYRTNCPRMLVHAFDLTCPRLGLRYSRERKRCARCESTLRRRPNALATKIVSSRDGASLCDLDLRQKVVAIDFVSGSHEHARNGSRGRRRNDRLHLHGRKNH